MVSLFKKKAKIELAVNGMTCGHCEMRVKKALLAVPGVQVSNPPTHSESRLQAPMPHV